VRENSKCQWGNWPFILVGESVATPLWSKCEEETRTPKSGILESSGTPEISGVDCKAQNTSPWGALYLVEKVLKSRCRKWPRMSHSDIYSTRYGQKKGRESNWQFDSRPLKVRNRPNPNACKRSATHCQKALEESYKFTSDFILIRGLSWELWAPKVPEVQIGTVSGLIFGSPGTKSHSDVGAAERRKEYYMGEGGGFHWVRAVVSLVSPGSPVACPRTKGAPECKLINLLVGLM
jgi:hypothetical protein